jgi:hypothetical protein
MNDLHDLIRSLQNNPQTLYSANETSELIYNLYTRIVTGLRLKAAVLIVMPLQVRYLNSDNELIKLPHDEVIQVDRISNIEIIDFIISKDKMVARLLKLISRDSNEVRFKIDVVDFIWDKTEKLG